MLHQREPSNTLRKEPATKDQILSESCIYLQCVYKTNLQGQKANQWLPGAGSRAHCKGAEGSSKGAGSVLELDRGYGTRWCVCVRCTLRLEMS